MVETRKPSFLITANVYHAMLTQEMSELRDVNARTSFRVAAIDFAAGRVRRGPRRLQAFGLEWAYRLWIEPGRLD